MGLFFATSSWISSDHPRARYVQALQYEKWIRPSSAEVIGLEEMTDDLQWLQQRWEDEGTWNVSPSMRGINQAGTKRAGERLMREQHRTLVISCRAKLQQRSLVVTGWENLETDVQWKVVVRSVRCCLAAQVPTLETAGKRWQLIRCLYPENETWALLWEVLEFCNNEKCFRLS